jgi:hypothetical protein
LHSKTIFQNSSKYVKLILYCQGGKVASDNTIARLPKNPAGSDDSSDADGTVFHGIAGHGFTLLPNYFRIFVGPEVVAMLEEFIIMPNRIIDTE